MDKHFQRGIFSVEVIRQSGFTQKPNVESFVTFTVKKVFYF